LDAGGDSPLDEGGAVAVREPETMATYETHGGGAPRPHIILGNVPTSLRRTPMSFVLRNGPVFGKQGIESKRNAWHFRYSYEIATEFNCSTMLS
jgi:hypothetical protein